MFDGEHLLLKVIFSYFLNEEKTYCLDQQVISGEEHYFTVGKQGVGEKTGNCLVNMENFRYMRLLPTLTQTLQLFCPEGSGSICQEPVQSQH